MIKYKTEDEITLMKKGGKILREVRDELEKITEAGMATKEIDNIAEKLIKDRGAEPSFNKVDGYSWTTCLSINDEIVHTPPSDKILKNGDVFTIDIGVFYEGFHTDTSTTFIVGGSSYNKSLVKFLDAGREALNKATKKFKLGSKLGSVSEIIQNVVEGAGYKIIRDLTGHGVGKELHEEPYIFGFLSGRKEDNLVIKKGLVVAIEIIYSLSTNELAYDENSDWNIKTSDGSIGACFENTVAISEKGTIVLT